MTAALTVLGIIAAFVIIVLIRSQKRKENTPKDTPSRQEPPKATPGNEGNDILREYDEHDMHPGIG